MTCLSLPSHRSGTARVAPGLPSRPGPPMLSRVGFLKVVMIPMFLPSRMSLALLPSQVSGGQGHLQVWQEGACSFNGVTAGQGSGIRRPIGSGA